MPFASSRCRTTFTRAPQPRLALTAIAALAAMLAVPTLASAQGTATGDDTNTVKLQTVEVTGSRIKRSEGATDSPVLTLSAKELAATGVASVGDILQRLSVSGSSLNTKFNSAGNFGFPADGGGVGSGSTTISLRHLGAKRVLVLVDGLRWVNESSASGVSAAVDLNTIPVSIIERVEILTDGASALYGSDAIGGVVNIITKKKQEGGLANVYYGDYTTGDGRTYTGNLSVGGSAGKLDFFMDVSHYQQREVGSDEFEQAAFPKPGTGLSFGSSATPTGRFVFVPDNPNTGGLCDTPDGPFCNVTPNGPAVPQVFPGNFHPFVGSQDRFNFAPFNYLLTPSKRTAIFAQTQYRLADSVRWSLKGLYQSRRSVNQAAPEPIFIGPGAGTGGLADTVGIDATNPFNPLGYSLDPNTNLIFAARRPVEGGPRVFSQDVDTRYISTGFDGSFTALDRLLSWDVNYASGVNDATQDITGTYNIRRIATALGPVAGCVAPCVPLNFFGGPGTITPAQLAYISFTERDSSRQSIELVTANLSGTIIPLPAGGLDFATGYEHRRLRGSYTPDAVVVAGETNGVPSLPTSGTYKVDEFFLELGVPLLANLPMARKLELSLATRYSDYSTFGDTTKSKFGLRWQPVADLTVRANFAQGFRAPSVGELFGSPARFDATITDPCNGATGQTAANCVALGVPNPATFEQANTQISVRTGGSRDLAPETAKSTTAGLVYSPAWADRKAWANRLDFDLSYYQHKVKNAVQAADAQTQLDRCVATLDPTLCAGITRGTSGDINGFNNSLRNLGQIKTDGIDFGFNYSSPRTPVGRFGLVSQSTWVHEYESRANDTGLLEPRRVGVEVADSGIPRWRSTLRLNWSLEALAATYAVRYLSGLTEQCGDVVDFASCGNQAEGTNRLGSVVYHDLQASYTVPVPRVNASLSAGVNNLFDKDPPVCVSCSLNGYDASLYDLPGQFAYVSAMLRF